MLQMVYSLRPMDLLDYLRTLPHGQRRPFAIRCGTTYGHMNNVAYGIKSCSPKLAFAIERESAGAVTRSDLRPDDASEIWPDLARA